MGWRDTELPMNERTRKDNIEVVETLCAEINQIKACIAKLGEEITELLPWWLSSTPSCRWPRLCARRRRRRMRRPSRTPS
eukprot:5692645-Heterocapsa_arctica.AAC.1